MAEKTFLSFNWNILINGMICGWIYVLCCEADVLTDMMLDCSQFSFCETKYDVQSGG